MRDTFKRSSAFDNDDKMAQKPDFLEGREGGGGVGPNPISQQIVFLKSQLKSHNPSPCCSNWNPIPIFLLFCFMNPSSSAENPISQPSKKGKSQLPFYSFTTLFLAFMFETHKNKKK